jgi:hypothetical protein
MKILQKHIMVKILVFLGVTKFINTRDMVLVKLVLLNSDLDVQETIPGQNVCDIAPQ